jgi:hypothetical protein
MPQILARGLMVLRETCVMPRIVNSDYSREAAQKGDTIDVPIPSVVGTRSVVPSNTLISPDDNTPARVQISLDQWIQSDPFHLTDKELVEVDRNKHYIPMLAGEAVRGLANNVNDFILGKYTGIYGYVGKAAGSAEVTPFATTVNAATDARKILNQQLCPRDMRRGVLDWDAEANALALAAFADAEKTMSSEVKIKGEIGEKYGISWLADDGIVTHTPGTETDVVLSGSHAAGVTTLNRASASGTYVLGDIITLNSATYAVTAAVASGVAAIPISPALRAAAASGNTMYRAEEHVVNLAFHRDAFAFATRPLVSNTIDMSLGSQILSAQDPKTGLVLRLEVSRQHKQSVWEFDILYGAALVRPELAVRIAG